MTKKRIVDPPAGWKYGFPRVDDWDPAVETREVWFVRMGYPQKMIDDGMLKWCRTWDADVEDYHSD